MIDEAQYKELLDSYAALGKRLRQLEDWQAQHVGTDLGGYAGKDMPHLMQKVSVLEFANGVGRLDRTGIQFSSENNTLEPVPLAIRVVKPDFIVDPDRLPPEGSFGYTWTWTLGDNADMSFEDGLARVLGDLTLNSEAAAYAKKVILDNISSSFLVAVNGIGGGFQTAFLKAEVDSSQNVSYIDISDNTALRIGLVAGDFDASDHPDGSIYYNVTDDQFKGVRNGVIESFSMGGSSVRLHVGPREWDHGGATDYWINAVSMANQSAAASATNPAGLPGWLMTLTSILATAGTSTGDFNSSSDNDPAILSTDAASDNLQTPPMFGGYAEMQRIETILGSAPTKLCAEFHARFSVATANENGTLIGFKAGVSARGAISSNGTNFLLRESGGFSDTGAAIDTNFHTWRIEVSAATTEWFIDGVSQGTIPTITDAWPTGFGFAASTTNRIQFAWAHIWYE